MDTWLPPTIYSVAFASAYRGAWNTRQPSPLSFSVVPQNKIAFYFGVSPIAMEYRLNNLGVCAYV